MTQAYATLISVALSQKSEIYVDTVSTTCGSGWVRSRLAAADLLLDQRCEQFALTTSTNLRAAHPPATAGGTDCVQQRIVTFEARSITQLSLHGADDSDFLHYAYNRVKEKK